MSPPLAAGDPVQTPLGKGVVREVRNRGRLLVDVGGRAVVLEASTVVPLDAPGTSRGRKAPPAAEPPPASDGREHTAQELDLHGLTVADALARAEQALNDALLAGAAELRLIHGRSGGRIRAALHQWLRSVSAVAAFRVDPRNPGVTIVRL